MACGEYIYKGRKFNARKETTDERYFTIPIYRFYIRCTRCSGEITFKTDPRNMDYECEKGARRNFEVWRQQPDSGAPTDYKESEEERLERLEREESERGAMAELEAKVTDAKREMEIADALDEIRTRNARNERARAKELDIKMEVMMLREQERARVALEDEEKARRAFMTESGERVRRIIFDDEDQGDEEMHGAMLGLSVTSTIGTPSSQRAQETESMPPPPLPLPAPTPPPTFKRAPKKKKDFSAALGIKRRVALV
jgi:hypothetical protein